MATMKRASMVGASLAGLTAYLAWGSFVRSREDELDFTYVPIVFVVATLFAAAIVLVLPFWRALRVKLSLDEGGVRCAVDGFVTYYPWLLLGSGCVENDWVGIPTLILTNESGRAFARVPLLGGRAHSNGTTLLQSYELRRSGAIARAPLVARALARQGRPLAAWLEALAALGAGGDKRTGYREQAPLDLGELPSIVSDLGQTPELRAAAAYVLLAQREPDLDTVRGAVTEAAPPLVQLLVHLSPAGKVIVSRESALDVRPFLEPDEAAELDRVA